MMKPLHSCILTLSTLSIITACSTVKTDDPLAPTPKMAEATDNSVNELGKGYSIFLRQCSQCHEQRIPNQIPTKEWHLIVPGMAWNAGLSEEEERLVTKYIIAASKRKAAQPSAN